VTTHTFTADLDSLLGETLTSDNGIRARAYLSPYGGAVVSGLDTLVGSAQLTLDDDDAFSAVVPEGMYKCEVRYIDPTGEGSGRPKLVTWETPFFDLLADTDLVDVVPAPPGVIDPLVTYADMQDVLALGTTNDSVIAAKINDDASATRAAGDGIYGHGTVDARAYGAAYDGIADDAAAIQAALDTGQDVVIAPLPGGAAINVKVGSTLTMLATKQGQKFKTIRATLKPSFLGDVVQLKGSYQHAQVSIDGALQPGAGDFSEVAGVRVGDSTTGYPFNASVAGTRVLNFKGNGILWDNGPMCDFTSVYISDVTYDGIRAGGVNQDANHGLFVGSHVIRAARYGYAFYSDPVPPSRLLDSRFNKFVEAKAFDCGIKDGSDVTTSGANFYIDTNSNFGHIFSELGIITLTADSYGNHLEVEPFNSMSPLAEDVYGHNDLGDGNRLEGMSYWERYETIKARFHRTEWNARFSGMRYVEQTGANTWLDKVIDTSADTYIDYDKDTGFDRIDRFNGHLGLPGTSDRVLLSNSHTGILTVPAATTVAAGAAYTSGVLVAGQSQYANGWATMFAHMTGVVVQVIITSGFDAKVEVRNVTGSSIDISSKMIRWTVLAYRA
jgi:hypothetical protein